MSVPRRTAPSAQLRDAMRREHCESADSEDVFESANYGVKTTPRTEFLFVTEPDSRTAWPCEIRLEPSLRRTPRTLASFLPELKQVGWRSGGDPSAIRVQSECHLNKSECIPSAFCPRVFTGERPPRQARGRDRLRGRALRDAAVHRSPVRA